MYVCTPGAQPNALGGQEMPDDPLKVELEMVLSCPVVLSTKH